MPSRQGRLLFTKHHLGVGTSLGVSEACAEFPSWKDVEQRPATKLEHENDVSNADTAKAYMHEQSLDGLISGWHAKAAPLKTVYLLLHGPG